MRWPARFAALLLCVALLTLAYAPFGQAYLAWIAFIPWLLTLRGFRSLWAAYAWGWLSGFLFFAANIWWLWTASIPGMLALMAYLALYWGLAAALIVRLRLLEPRHLLRWRHWDPPAMGEGGMPRTEQAIRAGRILPAALMLAVVWTACEWLRATLIDPRGFPWMFLGTSQCTFPLLCQIADAVGVYGISFWVMLINGLMLMGLTHGFRTKAIRPAVRSVLAVLVLVWGYGQFRISPGCTSPGPRVMVIQPNHPHLPGGARTVSREAAAEFHLDATREALRSTRADLIVWSETVMPPLNEEARHELRTTPGGQFMERTHQAIAQLARDAGAYLVTGANYVGQWEQHGSERLGTVLKNSAYLYLPDGSASPQRYDKTQLVSFSERVPFAGWAPRLHKIMLELAPPVASQPLIAGDPDALTVFNMQADGREYHFVTPICLENIYPAYISKLVMTPDRRGKRADFIVNLSNDGWFARMEHDQHLQMVQLRAIENRVPMVRACNTGISAYIDSYGQLEVILPAQQAGTLIFEPALDPRVTLYARYGDWFAKLCVVVTAGLVAVHVGLGLMRSRG